MGRQEQVDAFGGFSEVGCGKVREALCIVIPVYALLLQKFRAHLFSPFQCEYVPDILEGKQQSVADISVTVSSNEAQQILT